MGKHRIGRGLARREFAHDAASEEDEDAVGYPDQFGQVRGQHDNAGAPFGEVADQRVDLDLGADIDADGRLV